jgi:lysozyme
MQTDPRAVDLIRRFEGLRLQAYRDPVGLWTIGYGHTGPDVAAGLVIDEPTATLLLRRDIEQVEESLARLVRVPLSPGEHGALVAFAFNVGLAALAGSTLLKRLNAGDRAGAAREFGRWVHGTIAGRKVRLAGLVRRRRAEADLFLGEAPRPRSRTQVSSHAR